MPGNGNPSSLRDYGDDANFVVHDAALKQVTRIDLGSRPAPSEPDADDPEGEPKLQAHMADWIRHNQFTTNEESTKRIGFNSQRGTLMVQDR